MILDRIRIIDFLMALVTVFFIGCTLYNVHISKVVLTGSKIATDICFFPDNIEGRVVGRPSKLGKKWTTGFK